MQSERWQQIERLYHRALEQDAVARAAFVASKCGEDEALRKEVESLLAAGEDTEDYLETPALEVASRNHAQDEERWNLAGKLVSQYRVLERVEGAVFRCEDTRLGRTVALKFLPRLAGDSGAREQFSREARAASQLNHSNICTIYDIGEWEGMPFLVMELLEGESLQLRLTGGALPADELVDLALQIADGLDAAHFRGLLHRRLTTRNLFITSRGQVKVLGFGTAPADATACSPEQARGEALDGRSDLFSFGAVLYEMATGQRAFEGDPHTALLKHVPVPALRLNPSLPPKLDDVISKALEKDREVRYQHVADLRADLKRLKREMDSVRIAGSVSRARSSQPTRLGRYQITGTIGTGGMGTVYQGIDPVIGRDVAIKTILEDRLGSPEEAARMRESLKREARSAGSLAHPNIVTVFDAGEEEGVTYIVMELIHGSTLDTLLPAEGTFPMKRALEILGEAAAALDFAHHHGVVHRDVKPANVMLQASGTVKLADFGIARRVTGSSGTLTGIMGTPPFMAPEQLQGQQATPRSDQYSLAVVAWILLTGSKPFEGDELLPLISKILSQEPSANSALNSGADRALRRALAKNADQRFESCGLFVAALRDACIEQPAANLQSSRPKRLWILAAVVAACLAAAGVAWQLRPRVIVAHPQMTDSPPAVGALPKASPAEAADTARNPRATASPSSEHARVVSAAVACQAGKFDLKLYGDAVAGDMVWAGSLANGGRLNIENRRATTGQVQGDVLPPGVPVRISASPQWVRLGTVPAAANCWAPKLVFYNTGEPVPEIRIHWEVYQP
jgi:serine/threonine protein kinase